MTSSPVADEASGPVIRVSLDVTAVPRRPAGAGRYTLDLAQHLARRPDVELHLIARSDDPARWRAFAPTAEVVAAGPSPRPLRLLWEQAGLPKLLDQLDLDLHHGPHYTMPEGTTLPRVVTVHDLTVFDHPEWHQRSKIAIFRRAVRVAARQADALVCVSGATARRLRELFSPECPVHVVHHGVDQERFHPDETAEGTDLKILSDLGVKPPYVAFVGTIEPRKDVPGLVRAFDRMCLGHPGLELVLAGGGGWGGTELQATLSGTRHPDRVQRLGYLPDNAVPALLRQAAAVAYPSLEEGFGLPVLEALACGAPVVTTAGSAMQEVARGGAMLVPARDREALAGALDMLVRGDAGLEHRRARGLQIARDHTWEASAAGHVDTYRAALDRAQSALR